MNKKITHNYKCEVCGEPATRQQQEVVVEYEITANGNFENEDILGTNDNEEHFLCDDCEIDD